MGWNTEFNFGFQLKPRVSCRRYYNIAGNCGRICFRLQFYLYFTYRNVFGLEVCKKVNECISSYQIYQNITADALHTSQRNEFPFVHLGLAVNATENKNFQACLHCPLRLKCRKNGKRIDMKKKTQIRCPVKIISVILATTQYKQVIETTCYIF